MPIAVGSQTGLVSAPAVKAHKTQIVGHNMWRRMAAATITKKFRVDKRRAGTLARLARELDVTESDIVRRGIDLVAKVEARRQNVEKLIHILGDAPEPPKVRYRTKW